MKEYWIAKFLYLELEIYFEVVILKNIKLQ